MTDCTQKLEAAFRAQSALIAQAQELLTGYLSKRIAAPALIPRLLTLLDGPEQRDMEIVARAALGKDFGNDAYPQERHLHQKVSPSAVGSPLRERTDFASVATAESLRAAAQHVGN